MKEQGKVQPVSPQDVVEEKEKWIPDEVISAFNRLISVNFSCGYSSFKQNEVLTEIINNLKKSDLECVKKISYEYCEPYFTLELESLIFKCNWLDVEEIFRKAGWIVEYDKPGYNESYAATFNFRKK